MNQKGAMGIMVIVLLVVLMVVGGFVAWRVLFQQDSSSSTRTENESSAPQDTEKLAYSLENLYESNDFKITLPKGYFYNDFSNPDSLFSGDQTQDTSVRERALVSMDIMPLEESLSEPIPQNVDIETLIFQIKDKLEQQLTEMQKKSLLLRKLDNKPSTARFSISTFQENVDSPASEIGAVSTINELVFSADKKHVLEIKITTPTGAFLSAFATQQSMIESVEFK